MISSAVRAAGGMGAIMLALVLAPVSVSRASFAPPASRPLVVGWHDEFNRLDDWAPWTAFGGFDVLRGDVGKLTVMLGKTAMPLVHTKGYRAGAYQDITVDLNRYPVFAVRVLRVRRGASWDAQVFQYRDPAAPDARDISRSGGIPRPGNPERLAADLIGQSKQERAPGVVFIRLKPRPGGGGKQRVHLLLNLSGPHRQDYVDYAWARFIRPGDAARLRANPDLRNIRTVD